MRLPILFLCLTVCAALPAPLPESNPVVTVKNGSYNGIHNPTYNQDLFLGIPYALPPINELRFRLPKSLNLTWNGTQEATTYTPFCAGYGLDSIGKDISEDCLYLSIVRPSSMPENSSLPVGVWIHGGGLQSGGASDPRYNLSYIVSNSVSMGTPMVAVTIQYRLHAFGFLGGKEVIDEGVANLGYRDQRLALHWIQENVAAFGGDKSRVTIWGESAGAQSVGAHLLAYGGRDDELFRGAIAQSGGPAVSYAPESLTKGFNSTQYQSVYNRLVASTSCSATLHFNTTQNSLSCLRDLPFQELNTALNISSWGLGSFVPIIDNDFIVTHPTTQLSRGEFVKVPILIGANTDEGTAFGDFKGPSPSLTVNSTDDFLYALATTGVSHNSIEAQIIQALYPDVQTLGIPSLTTFPELLIEGSAATDKNGIQYRRTAAFFGDLIVHAPRRLTNRAWSKYNVTNYAFRFDVTPTMADPFKGATHFEEIAFVFNNTKGQGYAINPFSELTVEKEERFQEVVSKMSKSWVSFITTLDPNTNLVEEPTNWQTWDTGVGGAHGTGKSMVFTANTLSYLEEDLWRGEAIGWLIDNLLNVWGL